MPASKMLVYDVGAPNLTICPNGKCRSPKARIAEPGGRRGTEAVVVCDQCRRVYRRESLTARRLLAFWRPLAWEEQPYSAYEYDHALDYTIIFPC